MPEARAIRKRRVHSTERRFERLDESTLRNTGFFNGESYCVPTLTFLSGDALGRELPLLQPQVVLGRGHDADIVIVDPSVSRRHLRLVSRRVVGGGTQTLKVVVEDLGSKNGTLVNYRRVRRAVLRPGDKLFVGRIILKFEYRDLADQRFYNEIYRMATTDGLTGLLNKATITRALSDEAAKLQRYRGRLTAVLVDVDDLERLNDGFGHLVVDKALQLVAMVIRRNLRKQDRAGRFGGDEFLLVLPGTGARGATALAERLRGDLARTVSCEMGFASALTASVGVASASEFGTSAAHLLERAGAAVHVAKSKGKNRVEVWRTSDRVERRRPRSPW